MANGRSLENAFRDLVFKQTGDDIGESIEGPPNKNDAITLAILSLLTVLLQQMKSDITPVSETTNIRGVIPSPS